MRVLFVVPPRFGLHRGGLEIQVERTAKELRELGVDVVQYDPWQDELSSVDVCHAFSLDGSVLPFALEASKRRIPFVISPVSNLACAGIASVKIRVVLGKTLPAVFSDLKRAAAILKCAQAAVAQTQIEENLLHSAFGVARQRLVVVGNGLDRTLAGGSPDLFINRFGLREFVLCVGSIDRNKNQEMLIRAVRGSKLNLVLVGRAAVGQEVYAASCKALAGDNVLFTGFVEPGSPMLSSIYAAARVVAVPSYKETWGLAMYEAALAGCHLAVSSTVPLHEAVAHKVSVIHPSRVNQWRQTLEELSQTRATDDVSRIVDAQLPSWNSVANQILKVYGRVVDRKDLGRWHDE